jgi:hypothetical protein
MPEMMRAAVERLTDKTDQAFAILRELIRACPTFGALPTAGRVKIERQLFTVGPDS